MNSLLGFLGLGDPSTVEEGENQPDTLDGGNSSFDAGVAGRRVVFFLNGEKQIG